MNGPQISVEDFKALLLDLYLAQRDNQVLRAQLAAHAVEEQGGEVTGDGDAVLRDA